MVKSGKTVKMGWVLITLNYVIPLMVITGFTVFLIGELLHRQWGEAGISAGVCLLYLVQLGITMERQKNSRKNT